MKLICPNCQTVIFSENVNISSNLAKCNKCKSTHRISDLADRNIIEKINTPPRNAKIRVKKMQDGSIELFYPKQGFRASMIIPAIITLFGISLLSFWTWSVSREGSTFAIFSVPLWIIGILMLLELINSGTETQTLTLSKTSLILQKDRPIKPQKNVINLKNIQAIKIKNLGMMTFLDLFKFENMKLIFKKNFIYGRVKVPTIIFNRRAVYFLEDADYLEQKWITVILNNMVKSIRLQDEK